MNEAFSTSLQGSPERLRTHHYRLADRVLRIRFLGTELRELLGPALDHLEVEPTTEIDLCIDVWEGDCPVDPAHPRFSEPGSCFVHNLSQSVSVLERKKDHLVCCIRDRSRLSLYERGRPWHGCLCIWLLGRGLPVVHAGAVSGPGGGLLVGGPAGSGKTSTCLRAWRWGASYLGDDQVALETKDNRFYAHSLFGSTLLAPGGQERFPWLGPGEISSLPQELKSLHFLPAPKVPSCEVSAILLPRVHRTQPDHTLHLLPPSQALLELGPSSIQIGRLSPGRVGFELLAEISARIPAYRLTLGRRKGALPLEKWLA